MGIKQLVDRLDTDPSIRSKIMYLPEKLKVEYDLTDAELDAIKASDFDALDLTEAERGILKRRLNYHGI